MLKTTLGQVLINDALPPEMRDYNRVLDTKTLRKLADELAHKHPDQYRDITKNLFDIGRDASYSTGGLTFSLKHIKQTLAGQRAKLEVRKQLRGIMANPNLSEKERNLKILQLAANTQSKLVEDVFNEAMEQDNPFAVQAMSGVRGNKFSLSSLVGADMQYVNHKDEPIPIPVLNNYGRGLTPAEYFAGSFGARKGLIDTDRKSTRLNSSHVSESRMPSSA